MSAMRHGWVIPARSILLAGLVAAAALTLVPPFGSSDPLSYAAYGRILVTGHNPYAIGPDVLARLGDPVARAVQDWYTTPSDYGTVATGGQALASLIGGTSARLTVFVLSLLNLAAFGGTGLLLHRLGRGDRRRQIRAALLWTCNPLLLQVLVAGAHVDSQAVFFGVAAVAVFSPVVSAAPRAGTWAARRVGSWMALRAAAAGALIGLGFAVKVTIALLGAGLAVAAVQACQPRPRGTRWRFLAVVAGGLAAGFAVVAGAALAIGGRDGFRQAVQASSMVSIGSPWRVVRTLLHLGVGEAAADDVVKIAAAVLAAALAVLLLRGLPGAPPWGPWRGRVRDKIPSGALTATATLTMRGRGPRPIRRRCPRDWPGGRHSRSRWPGCSRGRTCCPGTTRSPGRCCRWWPPPALTGCCWPAPRRSPSATCRPGSRGSSYRPAWAGFSPWSGRE